MHKYDPRKKSQEELTRTLVAGERILNELLEELKPHKKNLSHQSWIITGPRGSGKSHILALLYRKIHGDKALAKYWLPLSFPEELFHLDSLYRFLLIIFENLFNDKNCKTDLSDIKSRFFGIKKRRIEGGLKKKIEIQHQISKELFELLSDTVKKTKKRLILLLENLQDIIGKSLSIDELKHLRSFLHENPDTFIIIGSALSVFPELESYDEPFYHFFKARSLESLDNDGIITFIRKTADFRNELKIASRIAANRHYIYTYRILTGGNPRLVLFLYELLADYEHLDIDIILSKITELTPYFQAKTLDESPKKRVIVNALATGSPAQTATEIAFETNEDAKSINELIKRLRDEGWVREISLNAPGIKKKEVFYSLRDYFFRIWYRVRMGGIDQSDVHCMAELVVFILDKEEIQKRLTLYKASNHKSRIIFEKAGELIHDSKFMKNIEFLQEQSKEAVSTEVRKIEWEIFENAKKEKWKEVIDSGEKLTQYDKKLINADTYFFIGFAYVNKEKYDKAIESYQKAIEIKPDKHEAWNDMGNSYAYKQDYDKAIESYQKAIEIKPDIHEAWNNMGNSYYNKQDYDKAIESYQKAIEIKPDIHEAWNNMGNSYYDKQDYDKSMECFQKAIEIKPDDYEAWNNMGISYAKRQDYDKAIECFQKAIEIKPDDYEAWNNMGLSYYYKQDYDKSIECYQKAIEIKPDDYEAWNNMGLSYINKEEYKEAYIAYSKFINYSPNFKQAIDFNIIHDLKKIAGHIFKSSDILKDLLSEKENMENKLEAVSRLLLLGKFIAITDSLDEMLKQKNLPEYGMKKMEFFIKAYVLDLLKNENMSPEILPLLKYWILITAKINNEKVVKKKFIEFIYHYIEMAGKEKVSLEFIEELMNRLYEMGIEISHTILSILKALKNPNTREAQVQMADPLFAEIVTRLSRKDTKTQ